MSFTVQDIYGQCCYALLEDAGLTLGVITEQQFLDIFGVVILDFAQRASLVKNIFTTTIYAGRAQYTVPDDVMKPELCFVGGRIIEKVAEADLMQGHFEWRKQWGPARQWHEDNLAPKRLEVFPTPDLNGVAYSGTTPPVGEYDVFNPSDHNLTIIGPAAPDQVTWSLGDVVPDVPDSLSPYLVYGVLAQVFSGDNELRDIQRSAYCKARWQEMISLCDSIAREELLEED